MLLNLLEYEQAAKAKMHPPYYEYYAGGVLDNSSLNDNRLAFERLRLRPKMLRGVAEVSAAMRLAGLELASPIVIAPAAMHKLAHPDGELATARATKNFGTLQILSTMSTVAVEEITALGHPVWFQLYLFKDRDWSAQIVRRAEAAGAQALVLTVDLPTQGLRENLRRAQFKTPPDLPFPNLLTDSYHLPVSELLSAVDANFDANLTWEDITWLKSLTALPLWLKGILRADDAERAVQAGAAGIIVSNHGARQLDTVIASIDALPDIYEAVGGELDIMLDGGVRRGGDVLKAVALGAKAVALGRSPLFGLAVNGEKGVEQVLELLHHEFINTMQQCGCASLEDISKDLVWKQ